MNTFFRYMNIQSENRKNFFQTKNAMVFSMSDFYIRVCKNLTLKLPCRKDEKGNLAEISSFFLKLFRIKTAVQLLKIYFSF